jgi:hypothetical protein
MENPYYDFLSEEISSPLEYHEPLPESILNDLRIRRENLKDLRSIQTILLVEEDQPYSLDEVLARVLALYRKFVPYK